METKLIWEAEKVDLLEDDIISELDLTRAGPVLSEHIFLFEQIQDNWEELGQRWDEMSAKLFPPELIRAGRAAQIRWCEPIQLYDKVRRQTATEEGIKPTLVR